MKVKEVMTVPVRTCDADSDLAAAAMNMWDGDCGVRPVVDRSREPASNEAAAGKNPFYHVGNIYNVLACRIASEAAAIAGVREATVYLVGQIGMPIAQPHLCAAQLALAPGVGLD